MGAQKARFCPPFFRHLFLKYSPIDGEVKAKAALPTPLCPSRPLGKFPKYRESGQSGQRKASFFATHRSSVFVSLVNKHRTPGRILWEQGIPILRESFRSRHHRVALQLRVVNDPSLGFNRSAVLACCNSIGFQATGDVRDGSQTGVDKAANQLKSSGGTFWCRWVSN